MSGRLAAFVLLVGAALTVQGARADEARGEPVDRWHVLHCGTLLAVPGESPLLKVSVIVKAGRVYEVRSGFVNPRTVERPSQIEILTVDLKDAFCMPGLVDAHTHVTMDPRAAERPLDSRRDTDADVAIRAVGIASALLRSGITTARDLGSRGFAAFALRDAIASGAVPGPRLLVAGAPITPTGGHSDDTIGPAGDPIALPGVLEGVADGPMEARKAVRIQVKRGADLIKLTATGGVLSSADAGLDRQLFDDELRAVVDTAHLLGRKVAAHAHGAEGIKAALRAGVDSIEHGTFLDDEAIELFLKTGAFLVPTVLAGETVAENGRRPGYYPAVIERKALEVGPQIKGALTRAHARGVRIAFGTDSGVSEHGRNARELVYMVEAGMSEMDVLTAATRTSSELLGLEQEIGSIEAGKAADVIATARNPLIDITELQRVRFVMKAGQVYKFETDDR